MDLADLVRRSWAEHESATADVADRLEAGVELVEPTDPGGTAAFMNLVNHAVGDHAGDRVRALRICEAAVSRLTDFSVKSPWLYLAVSRHLAGEVMAARAAERELGDDPTAPVRVGLLVAEGRANAGQWGAAAELYEDNLRVAEGLEPGHAAERAVAIVSNNVASALLDLDERQGPHDELMERAARAARTFWLVVGDWTNDERADYLLARVCNARGKAREGKATAERGLATIAANGEEPIDQAFLELARAEACRELGERDEHAASLERARALAADFEGDGLVGWFESELAKVS